MERNRATDEPSRLHRRRVAEQGDWRIRLDQICDAIAAGANSAAAIGAKLKAGTNCGSCIPEMKRLIAQASVAGAGEDTRKLATVN